MTWRVCIYAFAYLGCSVVNINTRQMCMRTAAAAFRPPALSSLLSLAGDVKCGVVMETAAGERLPKISPASLSNALVALLPNWFRVISISPMHLNLPSSWHSGIMGHFCCSFLCMSCAHFPDVTHRIDQFTRQKWNAGCGLMSVSAITKIIQLKRIFFIIPACIYFFLCCFFWFCAAKYENYTAPLISTLSCSF